MSHYIKSTFFLHTCHFQQVEKRKRLFSHFFLPLIPIIYSPNHFRRAKTKTWIHMNIIVKYSYKWLFTKEVCKVKTPQVKVKWMVGVTFWTQKENLIAMWKAKLHTRGCCVIYNMYNYNTLDDFKRNRTGTIYKDYNIQLHYNSTKFTIPSNANTRRRKNGGQSKMWLLNRYFFQRTS